MPDLILFAVRVWCRRCMVYLISLRFIRWSYQLLKYTAYCPIFGCAVHKDCKQWDSRVQLKCDCTQWRTGGEVKGKLANGVGSQYPSHYLGTWCIQHYYRWCAHLGCQQSTELTPPPIYMDLSFSPKDEIWFLRMCHHISNAVYNRPLSQVVAKVQNIRTSCGDLSGWIPFFRQKVIFWYHVTRSSLCIGTPMIEFRGDPRPVSTPLTVEVWIESKNFAERHWQSKYG